MKSGFLMPGVFEFKECPRLLLVLASYFGLNFLYDLHTFTHLTAETMQTKACDNRHHQGILLDVFVNILSKIIFDILIHFYYCIHLISIYFSY